MEKKMVIVPFEVELAKKITNGEVNGNIVTRDGRNARVICWDKKSDSIYNIVGLIDGNIMEIMLTYTTNGYEVQEEERNNDLMLEIPEYMTFKDGDVIAFGHTEKSIAIGIFHRNKNYKSHECYVKLDWSLGLVYDVNPLTYNNARFATEEEKQKLIDALKESKDPEAKECLKMLGIEIKPKCEFRPFDRVLCREQQGGVWYADIFSHIRDDGKFVCIGCSWSYSIPYNDQTAHLLGTDKDWEEEK